MDVISFHGEAFLYCLARSQVFVDFQASLMARMLYLTNPFSGIPIIFAVTATKWDKNYKLYPPAVPKPIN